MSCPTCHQNVSCNQDDLGSTVHISLCALTRQAKRIADALESTNCFLERQLIRSADAQERIADILEAQRADVLREREVDEMHEEAMLRKAQRERTT